jgi:hypothetical protein
VIAVFTKYDQFKCDIIFKMEDQGHDPALFNKELERIFREHYLADLRGTPPFVCLEGEGIINQPCTTLISVMQECIRRVHDAWNLLKQLPMHSIVVQFHSYSWQYKRIIWS